MVRRGAAGLAAGCPQLITPLNFDQPHNAARFQALGVGFRLQPKDCKGAQAVENVRELLESSSIRERCQEIQGRFAGADPLDLACREVEGLLGR